MKKSSIAITLFGAALLFSTGAFAGNGNKGALRLDENITVGGTALQPGNYKVEWNGNGADVHVSLLKGNQTVATFPAHLGQQPQPNQGDAYSSADDPNGSKSLTAIYFGGKRYFLEIEDTAASQRNASSQNASSSK